MRNLVLFLVLIVLTSCGDGTTQPRHRDSGNLVVYIFWDGRGIPSKQVDIMETGESQFTNERGLAFFDLPTGRYTVRAYDIGQGGPCCAYLDEKVTVVFDKTARVEIYDCLPCVSPDWLENN